MDPTSSTTLVEPHDSMAWYRTEIDHGVPAGFAVLLVVLALALGLALGVLVARRQPSSATRSAV